MKARLLLLASALSLSPAQTVSPPSAYVVRLEERLSSAAAGPGMSNLFFEPASLQVAARGDSVGHALLTRVAGHDLLIERRWNDGAWQYRVDRNANGTFGDEDWLVFVPMGALGVATVELVVPGVQLSRVVMRVLTSADGYVYGRAVQEWVGTIRVPGVAPTRVLIRPTGRMDPVPTAGGPYELLIDRDGDGTFRDVADSTSTGQPHPTALVRPDQPFRLGAAVLSISALQLSQSEGRLDLRDDPARTGVNMGLYAPPVASQLLDGTPVSIAQLRGKPAILEFWSVHCPYSEKIRPHIAALASQFGEGVQWVAMARESDADTLRQHLQTHRMTPLHWRHDADTWTLYNPSTITPLFVVLDAEGRIRGVATGAHASGYLAAQLRALLVESGTHRSTHHSEERPENSMPRRRVNR